MTLLIILADLKSAVSLSLIILIIIITIIIIIIIICNFFTPVVAGGLSLKSERQ